MEAQHRRPSRHVLAECRQMTRADKMPRSSEDRIIQTCIDPAPGATALTRILEQAHSKELW